MIIIFFASKKDSLYSLAVWGTIVILFLSIILNFSLTLISFFWAFIGIIAIGFLLWIWFGTSYRIQNETVKIKNGPFKWTINIQDINCISKRKSLLATPSLSVNRLVLHSSKYGEMLLSPQEESAFIELLLTKNPQIKLDENISNT